MEKTKPLLERESGQSYRRPFEVPFGMSILSLWCSIRPPLSALLSNSFGLMNNTGLSRSKKTPGAEDLRIAGLSAITLSQSAPRMA